MINVLFTESEFEDLKRSVRKEFDENIYSWRDAEIIEKARRYGMIELSEEMIRDRELAEK